MFLYFSHSLAASVVFERYGIFRVFAVSQVLHSPLKLPYYLLNQKDFMRLVVLSRNNFYASSNHHKQNIFVTSLSPCDKKKSYFYMTFYSISPFDSFNNAWSFYSYYLYISPLKVNGSIKICLLLVRLNLCRFNLVTQLILFIFVW